MNIKTTVRLFFVALVSAIAIVACREDRQSVNDPISAGMEANGNYAWIYSVTYDSGHAWLPERYPYDTVAARATWRPVAARYRYKCGTGSYGSWQLFNESTGKAVLTCTGTIATIQAGLNDSLNTSNKGYVVVDTGTNRVRVIAEMEVEGLDDPAKVDSIKWPQVAAYPYYVLHADMPKAVAKFGYSLPRKINLHICQNITCNYYTADSIFLSVFSSYFYGPSPWYILGHEAGHAYHDIALGSHAGSNPTEVGDISEPFGYFFGVYIMGHRSYADTSGTPPQGDGTGEDEWLYEENFGWSSVDTSDHNNDPMASFKANFFYDLVDMASDSNGQWRAVDGDDDSLATSSSAPAKYLADLMTTKCVAYTSDNVAHSPPHFIAELLACAERQSPTTFLGNVPTWFQDNWRVMSTGQYRHVTNYSETITEPSGWNSSRIRQNWMWNIYGSSAGP